MSKICFSIKFPYWKIIHFDSGKIVAESRFACFKGLAHYDRHGKFIGKSVRNFIGELIHYDHKGRCTGYSRKSSFATTTIFSYRGEVKGKTYSLLGIVFFYVDFVE